MSMTYSNVRLTVCAQFSDLFNVKQGGEQKGSVRPLAQKGALRAKHITFCDLQHFKTCFANGPCTHFCSLVKTNAGFKVVIEVIYFLYTSC